MRGEQYLKVIGNKLEYTILLKRNITIIRGDSGSGKTTLCTSILRAGDSGASKFYKVQASATVLVAPSRWEEAKRVLSLSDNCIILFDESAEYVNTKEFAQSILNTSNYYVIINREVLKNIPYSFTEIYELQTIKVSNNYLITLNPLYNKSVYGTSFECVITEDSGSGRDMFKRVFKNVLSTPGGNSSIASSIQSSLSIGKPLAIVDGAAFGPYIDDIYRKFISKSKCTIWLPESFEYLLIQSEIIWRKDAEEILMNPVTQIESSLFFTWEQFFTWLAQDIMKNYPGHNYSKSALPDWYFEKQNVDKFENILPVQFS